jgi:hypothetical protein
VQINACKVKLLGRDEDLALVHATELSIDAEVLLIEPLVDGVEETTGSREFS